MDITLKQTQQLIKSLQRTTETILSMYNLLKSSPRMIQINSLIDYAKNIQKMIQVFYQLIPKKCVPMYVHKKLQNQQIQKDNLIRKLQQSQKQLKIQNRVLQQKLNNFILNKQDQPITKSNSRSQYKAAHRKSLSLKKISQGQLVQNTMDLYKMKSKVSFPTLGSEKREKKLHNFVQNPGDGNERLIYHLMNKY